MSNVYTIGETTYDIVFKNNQPIRGVVGGSALNTSVSLGRCGISVFFLSSIGSDYIAKMSIKFLLENGVNCDHVVRFLGNSRVSLAFMNMDNNAEYQFYNADSNSSFVFPEVKSSDYIIFGSSNAIKDDGRKELLNFLDRAMKTALIVYDPNIRDVTPEVKRKVEENFSHCHIVKASTQDFIHLYNMNNADDIFSELQRFGVNVLILTDGEKPVIVKAESFLKSYQPIKVKAISTIGAGDNFTAGVIAGMIKYDIHLKDILYLEESVCDELIRYGNSFASEVCMSELNYISIDFGKII
jgi:fructokinase